jgi:hypothetical protein
LTTNRFFECCISHPQVLNQVPAPSKYTSQPPPQTSYNLTVLFKPAWMHSERKTKKNNKQRMKRKPQEEQSPNPESEQPPTQKQ